MGLCFFLSKILQYILSPILFLIFFLPIYSFRLLVILISKCTLPRDSKIIEIRNAMFSPNFSTLSPMGTLIAPYMFKGKIDADKVFQNYTKLANKYKRLRSVPRMHLLYCFWVPLPDTQFNIKNHIQEIRIKESKIYPTTAEEAAPFTISNGDYKMVKKRLLEEPFVKGQSPWMVYILRNVQCEVNGECDVVIFKWHHGIADGLSVFKMFAEETEPKLVAPTFDPIPVWLDVAMALRAWFSIVNRKLAGGVGQVGKSLLTPSAGQLKRGNDFYLASSHPIPLEYIKNIKNEHGTSFNSVVLYALSNTLRNYVIGKEGKEARLPPYVNTSVVLPIPGHPDNKLGNHWSWSVIKLPIPSLSETRGSREILKEIFNLVKNGREKALKNFRRIPLFGGLPFLFHGGILEPHSLVLSDVSGPPHPVHLYGLKVVDMSFHINIPPSIVAIFCSSLSYDGKWKFAFTIDGSVAGSQEDADNLANLVVTQILEMST